MPTPSRIKNYSKTAFDDSVQFWQAGKGVGSIESITSVADVLEEFGSIRAYKVLGNSDFKFYEKSFFSCLIISLFLYFFSKRIQ